MKTTALFVLTRVTPVSDLTKRTLLTITGTSIEQRTSQVPMPTFNSPISQALECERRASE